jgi:hypothetical protein
VRVPHFREQCIDVYANQFTGTRPLAAPRQTGLQEKVMLAKDASIVNYHWGDYSIDLAGFIHQNRVPSIGLFFHSVREYSAYLVEGSRFRICNSMTQHLNG